MTYIELRHVVGSHSFALIAELVEKEEPSETILPDEASEAEEGEGGDGGERDLHNAVVGPRVVAVAVRTGQ